MLVSKHNLEVFNGEEHEMIVDGVTSTQTYSWVGFFEQEHIYRHDKTFDTFKEAYDFMLKIFFKANARGAVSLSEKHWGVAENEIAY